MSSSYCVKCRKDTPTNNTHYENMSRKTKTGKTVNQTLMKGSCAVCGTKKTKFVKAAENQGHGVPIQAIKNMMSQAKNNDSDSDTNDKKSSSNTMYPPLFRGSGASYRVEKRDISKRTYTALKELINSGKAGYLTFGNTKYYVSPANVAQFRKAHEKGVLKKAAQVMSGERSHQEVSQKMQAKGAGMDSLGVLSDILGVVGMLL